jgi:hypothetical protein
MNDDAFLNAVIHNLRQIAEEMSQRNYITQGGALFCFAEVLAHDDNEGPTSEHLRDTLAVMVADLVVK